MSGESLINTESVTIIKLFAIGAQLTEVDQDLYKDFTLTVSSRWQQEMSETIFEVVNTEADKADHKRRTNARKNTSASSGPTPAGASAVGVSNPIEDDEDSIGGGATAGASNSPAASLANPTSQAVSPRLPSLPQVITVLYCMLSDY